jgi:predicted metal-binding membrane protein
LKDATPPASPAARGVDEAQRQPSIASLSRRHRILISTCLALVTALAWGYLFLLDRRMSSSMRAGALTTALGMPMAGPWTGADVLLTFLMWTVMMVGMMAGAGAPVLLLFAAARAERGRGVPLAVLTFGLGYIAVWTGFSAFATLVQWILHEAALLSPAMSTSSPHLAGAILIAAGAYQWTPLKFACLTRCRHPLGFLMTNWRNGNIGAFRMGVDHGTYCLGCCWALMGVLFVAGVMNLAWVAALGAFVLFEKIGPRGVAVARLGGTVMIAVGIFVLAGTA